MKLSIFVAALITFSDLCFAGVADGVVITCVGDGPKTMITITGPRSALMLVEGANSAFPVAIQDSGGKKVFQIHPKMFLIVNPADGQAFVSRLDGSAQDLPYMCHN